MKIIDINVSLGNWPFREFLQDSAIKLSRHLKSEGISLALVSSIETTFYPDPGAYNKLLMERLRPYSTLRPVMVLNPTLSNWKKHFERYVAIQNIQAIKILPNYHNYSLSEKSVNDLMNELIKRKIVLMVQMRLEDERNQYSLLKVPGIETKEVIKFANRFQEVPILCLCPYFAEAVTLLKETTNIYVDISFIERLDTIVSLLKEIPAGRVLFGSHTPFLYTRSAVMKIESADIPREDLKAIMFNNAGRLLKLKERL